MFLFYFLNKLNLGLVGEGSAEFVACKLVLKKTWEVLKPNVLVRVSLIKSKPVRFVSLVPIFVSKLMLRVEAGFNYLWETRDKRITWERKNKIIFCCCCCCCLCRKAKRLKNRRSISARVKNINRGGWLRDYSFKLDLIVHWVENVAIFQRPDSTVPWREHEWCIWLDCFPVNMLLIPRKRVLFSYDNYNFNSNFWVFFV